MPSFLRNAFDLADDDEVVDVTLAELARRTLTLNDGDVSMLPSPSCIFSSFSNSTWMPESPLLHLSRRWCFVLRRSLLERHMSGPKRYFVVSAEVAVASNVVVGTAVVVAVTAVTDDAADTDDGVALVLPPLNWENVFLNFCKTLADMLGWWWLSVIFSTSSVLTFPLIGGASAGLSHSDGLETARIWRDCDEPKTKGRTNKTLEMVMRKLFFGFFAEKSYAGSLMIHGIQQIFRKRKHKHSTFHLLPQTTPVRARSFLPEFCISVASFSSKNQNESSLSLSHRSQRQYQPPLKSTRTNMMMDECCANNELRTVYTYLLEHNYNWTTSAEKTERDRKIKIETESTVCINRSLTNRTTNYRNWPWALALSWKKKIFFCALITIAINHTKTNASFMNTNIDAGCRGFVCVYVCVFVWVFVCSRLRLSRGCTAVRLPQLSWPRAHTCRA